MIEHGELSRFVERCYWEGLERAKGAERWSRELYNAIGLYGIGVMEEVDGLRDRYTAKQAAWVIGRIMELRDRDIEKRKWVEKLVYG